MEGTDRPFLAPRKNGGFAPGTDFKMGDMICLFAKARITKSK
jgi:hypothetical protein